MASTENQKTGPETVVQIRRCACVVKGGRRFSFSALVVVGDGKGRVGIGYGKAIEVPMAVDKAVKVANRSMVSMPVVNQTIPHTVEGRFGTARVVLIPASPGTGIKAGATVRAVVESAGITNILTKVRGSSNPINLLKATINALQLLRTREAVARLRGVEL